jgi:hypothetical protein
MAKSTKIYIDHVATPEGSDALPPTLGAMDESGVLGALRICVGGIGFCGRSLRCDCLEVVNSISEHRSSRGVACNRRGGVVLAPP